MKILFLSFAFFITTLLSSQISFTNETIQLTDPTHYSGNAVTMQDINGDGLDDLVILDNARELRIEFQQMNGTWTSYSGGTMDDGNAWGMVVADTDNNGFGDIFSGLSNGNPNYAKANANGTDWVITDLEGYPLFYQGSSLGDVDNDGDLDLYVCADTDESAIWENDGSGNMTFSGTGLIDLTVQGWDGSGNYGSTFTDYDLDGDLDLYISHCRQGVQSDTDPRRINQLFENDGNNNYTENAAAFGLAIGAQTWTSDFGDMDNDGDFDIIMTNHDVNNMLLENLDGSDQYNDIFDQSGLDMTVGLPIQGLFRDFDNDMYLDILITGNEHALYRNNGDNTFTLLDDVFSGEDIESFATGDANHDGFIDVYASYAQIYNNPSNIPDALWINEGNENNFITVVLEGTISNRSAVGTQVRAYGPWGMQVREVRAGESYGMVNSLHQHFGLAENTQVDSLVIDWPTSGIHQVIIDPVINQFVTVVEGTCEAPVAIIANAHDAVLCNGQTLTLEAMQGTDVSYLWSNGESGPSIDVDAAGTYMVEVTDNVTGCSAISTSVNVSISPDETPEVTVSGDLEICEGSSVTLTSSFADGGYLWSDGTTTNQQLVVTEAGTYSVTIQGACDTFTSESVLVSTQASPAAAPMADDESIIAGNSVTLEATGIGDDFHWYDQALGGNLLFEGSQYTTPVLNSTTMYWVESVYTYGGGDGVGARPENSPTNGQYHTNANFYLEFDAYEDFIIDAVKVYAENEEERNIRLMDANGDEIMSLSQVIPAGESYVNLGFYVEAGTNYSLRADNDPGLWRDDDDDNVNFPYDIATYGSITGTNVNQQNADRYYYFFYDWQVSLPELVCSSDREEVVVDVITSLSEESALQAGVYPNPAHDRLFIETSRQLTGVSLELIDIKGKVVRLENFNGFGNQPFEMEVNGFARGIYTLRITSDQGVQTIRVEVE